MKSIKKIFDTARPHFTGRGKFSSLYPLFDATETVFFSPKHTTNIFPSIRDSLDLKRYMSFVLLALMPPFLMGIWNTGYQANLASGLSTDLMQVIIRGLIIVMPIVIVSYAVGLFWEILFASIRKHKVSEGFLVTGLLFPLTLPPTVPLWQVAVGISFGVVIGKEVFGGTGRNILNPALTARAFLFFAYPVKMSGDQVWTASVGSAGADAVSGATPLAITAVSDAGSKITTVLDQAGFSFETLFFGIHPGSIGETSALASLIGAIILIVVGVASYRIILGGVLGVLVTGYLLQLAMPGAVSAWFALDPHYHLIMGSFAFGITYMATDPVSGPGMLKARWVYGFFIGALTVIVRVFNPAYPEGVMLSILFMNLFAPLLDHIEIAFRVKKRIPNV